MPITRRDDWMQLNDGKTGDVFELFGQKFYFTKTDPTWNWFFMVMMFMR